MKAINAQSDATLVRAIIAMAYSLELAPVAEGIETKEQLEKLVELGCVFGQGYFFSQALPLATLKSWQLESAETVSPLG